MNPPDPTSSDARAPGVAPLDWPRAAGRAAPVLAEVARQLGRRRRRRNAMAGIAAALFLAAASPWLVRNLRGPEEFSTAAAHRSVQRLADGSEAELNAGTTLQVDFRHDRRRTRLTGGEAFFSVAKDPAHPFFVETPAGTVRVTGTKFNVRVAGDTVEVTLLEGKVAFARPDGFEHALHPGEQIAASPAGVRQRALDAEELAATEAWRQGVLVMDRLTLGDAVRRMADYHGLDIAVPESLAGRHMGGSCPLDDLTGFFAALEQALPLQVLPRSDGGYRLAPIRR